jgi:histidinol-phosphate aminotransferase
MASQPIEQVSDFAAPWIRTLAPYSPGKPLSALERELGIRDSIKLASNENPFGPGAAAQAAYRDAAQTLGRYPDGSGFALRQAIASHHCVESDWVTLGNGSNDVLDLIARTFLTPTSHAVFSEYAFAVYPLVTQATGACATVAPAHHYGHDLAALRASITDHTRLVWIANPNNPTGTWLGRDALYEFITELPTHCLCVLDEAYADYVTEPEYGTGLDWLAEQPRLIIVRTFSKIHGLAALRIGYALSHPEIAELLNRVRQPFNVNMPGQDAAIAALADHDHIQRSIVHNTTYRQQLARDCQALGYEVIPSVGNFITFAGQEPASQLDQRLQRMGIICRPLANYGLPHHLRVTVGLQHENERFIAALRSLQGAPL